MRKIITMFLFIAGAAIFAAEEQFQQESADKNLIANPDLDHPVSVTWSCNKESFKQIKEGDKKVVIFVGHNPPEGDRRTIQLIKIKPEEVTGKTFTLSVMVKIEKLSGVVRFSIREINDKGGSLYYRDIKLTKNDVGDWKEYRKTVTASPQTTSIGVYVTGDYLLPEDKVMFSDLKLIREK